MSEGAGSGLSLARRRGVIFASVLATVVIVLDMNLTPIALPHMQGGLSATRTQMTGVLTAYFVAVSVMTACSGWIAGRIGRKRLYVLGLIGFAGASLLSGSATSVPEMVVYRAFQGACSAPIIPLSQAIMLDSTPRERHGQALALWAVGVMAAPVFGPVIGGWVTDVYGWRWIYYMNAPLGALAALLSAAFLVETEVVRDRRFDWFGFAALAVSIASAQFMLDNGERLGWFGSFEILLAAFAAGLALYIFLAHSATTDEPFVSRAVAGDFNFMVGMIFVFLFGMIVISTNVILPLFLQTVQGLPVSDAGLILAPRGIGSVIGLLLVGRLTRRFDPRLLVGIGFGLVALSTHHLSTLTADLAPGAFVVATLLQGCGIGMIFVPLTVLAFATLPQRYRTEASGLWSLIRNYGSTVGVPIVINALNTTAATAESHLGESVTRYRDALRLPGVPEAWTSFDLPSTMRLQQAIAHQAEAIGFLADFEMIFWWAVFSIPLVLLMRAPDRSREEAG